MYDFVVAGGTVVDPASGMDAQMDVAVRNGSVECVEEHVDARGAPVHRVDGCLVCPGLIDLHTHVYRGCQWGVDADSLGPPTGVTTCVDFGTAGAGNFDGFLRHVIRPGLVRIYSFLHIAYTGLLGAVHIPRALRIIGELEDLRLAIVEEAVRVGAQYPEVIRGIKVRASIESARENAVQAIVLAKKAATILEVPLAVHVGRPPAVIEEVLSLLETGDILTHSYRGPMNSLLDRDGRVLPEAKDARERGVLFDIGHGGGSFSFESAKRLLGEGFPPDTISSDVHAYSIFGPAFDLPTTMTKFLGLGLPMSDIIRAVTATPARALGMEDRLGTLAPGGPADITVLKLGSGSFHLEDAVGIEMKVDRRFLPVMTFKQGELLWAEA